MTGAVPEDDPRPRDVVAEGQDEPGERQHPRDIALEHATPEQVEQAEQIEEHTEGR